MLHAHDEFLNFLPADERKDPWPAYYKRLTSVDYETRLQASRAWNKWELSISQLVPGSDVYDVLSNDTWCLQHARMEAHYESNGAFLEEGQLLKPENIAKIKHIPCEYLDCDIVDEHVFAELQLARELAVLEFDDASTRDC